MSAVSAEKILVTGANGFVGTALVRHLRAQGRDTRAALRRPTVPTMLDSVAVGDLDADTDWRAALANVTAVVHCAGRAHAARETHADVLPLYRAVNVAATARLARQAAEAGVRRFVFLSTIHVLGTVSGTRPFRADDPPAPRSPYAISKLEAETALYASAAASGMELVVLRPPLIYGPGARANFARLVAAVRHGLPLPLAGIQNRRSLLALDNLVDLIARCLDHPAADGQTFLAADGEDISTTELVLQLGAALGRRPRLFALPTGALRFAARLLGRESMAEGLLDSLQVDASATCATLQWQPSVTVAAGLRRAVAPAAC